MATKKKQKRTKKYNPEKVKPSVKKAFRTLYLARPMRENVVLELSGYIDEAFAILSLGGASVKHFETLAEAVDVALVMSARFFNKQYFDEMMAARRAIERLHDRYLKYKTFAFDGPGRTAVAKAIQINQVMMSNITGAELINLLDERRKLIESGNFYKGDQEAEVIVETNPKKNKAESQPA